MTRPICDYRGLVKRSRKEEQGRKAFWLAAASQWSLFIRENTQKNTVRLRVNNQKNNIVLYVLA
jgi:hypothetical protein